MPEISKRFEREAVNVKHSIDSLKRTIEVLKGGDWFGEGANAFYREMESEVMPAMQRLLKTLEMASGVIQAIERLLHEAEQTIGGLFAVILSSLGADIGVGEGGSLGALSGRCRGRCRGGWRRRRRRSRPYEDTRETRLGWGRRWLRRRGWWRWLGGGGGGSWDGEIGFKQEKPARALQGNPPQHPGGPETSGDLPDRGSCPPCIFAAKNAANRTEAREYLPASSGPSPPARPGAQAAPGAQCVGRIQSRWYRGQTFQQQIACAARLGEVLTFAQAKRKCESQSQGLVRAVAGRETPPQQDV